MCKVWIVCVMLASFVAASFGVGAEPIAPVQKLTAEPKITQETVVDLPYKPVDGVEDFENTPEEDAGFEEDAPEKHYDWDSLVFVPSKFPDLPKAPDPEM